jgi:hypothetical protein
MSLTLDPSIRALNACGCCDGLTAATPVAIQNRPGLTAIAYRAGVYAQFKETLLARITTSRQPALAALATRDADDFSIALFDAWAAVGDVLTFYQERIANENYIGTATDLLSIVELARLIDYQLQPGVAASVNLAFTLEDAPGALGQALGVGTTAQVVPSPPLRVVIDVGTKVLSVPAAGEQALTFETIEPIEARAEWNALKPRLRQPQILSTGADAVTLAGTATNLQPGDSVLILDSNSSIVTRVLKVTPDSDAKLTQVDFKSHPAFPPALRPLTGLAKGDVNALSQKVDITDGVVSAQVLPKTWEAQDLEAVVKIQGWDEQALIANIARQTQGQPPNAPNTGVFAFRQRAAIFGHNAPAWASLSANLRFGQMLVDSTNANIPVPATFPKAQDWDTNIPPAIENSNQIILDNVYPSITKGSFVALVAPSPTPDAPFIQVCQVLENVSLSVSRYAISSKVSRLTVALLAPLAGAGNFNMRNTSVLVGSEELPLSDLPVPDDVAGGSILLGATVFGLKPGQTVVLTGQRTDLKNTSASESLTLKSVSIDGGFTNLTFQTFLLYSYVRGSVTLNANIAAATHGEAVSEVFGNGDASQPFQKFKLRQPPLTYVSSPTPTGAESTLEVRVNDLLWKEVPTLFGHGPNERVYVNRSDAAGNTNVVFGDANTGARPATGTNNIRARYRKGLGVAGVLPENRLTQILTRPLGLKGVTNPLPAAGGADPERPEDIRRNAPLPIRTLGRIVSLQDYEDFARAFAGIGKSLATWTWSGDIRSVFVTIAGVNGADVPNTSRLYTNLLNAMIAAGDPTVPLAVQAFTPRLFRVSAALAVDPDFIPGKVVAAVIDKLRTEFAFDARELGQPVALSEVYAAIQAVKGVVAVNIKTLFRADGAEDRLQFLPAAAPQAGTESPFGAELLTLDPRPVQIEVLP